ncbi:hypothetical protein, partial [Bradyrhizobium denitrificans]|uniref:hypothetical protein n=1 Tax=Bradyrhizobium denitrificans TaxID=2734912 RepID=UPI0020233451
MTERACSTGGHINRDGAQRATADDIEEVTGQNWTDNVRIPTKSPRRTDMKSPVDSETMSPT